MKLPNAEQAIVDINKLRNYCLNFEHSDGQHKARVFASALGMTIADAEELREALLSAASTYDTIPTEQDEYGQRYKIDFVIIRGDRQARVRSSWITRKGENFPRLTGCYIIK